MVFSLTFHGGAREATGSNFLLQTPSAKILVDCGLFQGCHFCEGRNRQSFPYDPASLDAVLVTHAHVDHTGRLPKLVRDGFRGKIFSTPPTRDFASLLLEDSADIIREEAQERREEPFYEVRDVARAMERFATFPYHETFSVARGVSARFLDAGHILGSATIVVEADKRRFAFSGDLGNAPTPLLPDPESVDEADYLLIESVYGGRRHEDRAQRRELLAHAVRDTAQRNGTLLIPVFAVERTQEILAELNSLIAEKSITSVPVFVDSPLAIRATKVYQKYPAYYNAEAQEDIMSGDLPFRFPGLRYCMTREESKAINDVPPPKIILSGSGMFQGGRILHHLRRYVSDEKSLLLMVGYQAAGTLGRRLLARAPSVRLFGEDLPVRAQVRLIGGYSSHADQDGLLKWFGAMKAFPKRVFVVQGEEAGSLALREELRSRFQVDAAVPTLDERVALQ